MNDYPQSLVPLNHVEPVPRRIRAFLGDRTVLDTTSALYVWEWTYYPQFYIPLADIADDVLVDEGREEHTSRGTSRLYGIRAGDRHHPQVARHYTSSKIDGISGMVRFDWSALDRWFEEDEEVFVHPRDPYTRVDALRSTRTVVVELNGVEVARSSSPVMVFETGLPTRYYLNRTEVNFEYLESTDTVSSCPYKGITSAYWSIRLGADTFPDLAWSYEFPTRQLLPIAGLVAFYNEHVDLVIDGDKLERPSTHFS